MACDQFFARIFLFLCLFSTPLLQIKAQTNAAPGQIRPALQILDSTKEQDGLVGSVRRVKTEYSKITIKDGSPIEGPRQLLEVTTYGVKGNRVENVSYPINDSDVGREEYKYDDHGNIVEKVLRDESGTVLSREAYEYVFDNVGNWTKMVTSLVVIENGELKREPTEVTYRSLTYYAGDPTPRATSVAETAVVKPMPQSNGDRSEKPLESSMDETISPKQPKIDEPTTTAGPGNRAVDKKDERANGHASGPVSQIQLATPTLVMAPAVESSNRSVEKPSAAKRESSETSNATAVTSEPEKGLSKTAKKAKIESGTSTTDTVGQADPPKEPEAEKVAIGNSQPATGRAPVTPTNGNTSPGAGEARGSSNTSIALNAASPATENVESASAENTATLTKALEFYRLGRQRFEAGDVSSAITAYLESITLEPNSAEIHLNLGHAYLTSKKDKDAVKSFKEAVRLNPELKEAYYGLGFVSFRLARFKEAMEAFKKATELSPDMAKAHYGLALVYQELGKLDLLVQEQRLLQRLDPKLANRLVQAFSEVDFSCRQTGTRYCR
ncbi:MAG TPA: tetratricopeptide repeat protein [Pyrinomonadaceae bacterium]